MQQRLPNNLHTCLNDLGKVAKNHRLKLKLSQEKLGFLMGFSSPTQICQFEVGGYGVSILPMRFARAEVLLEMQGMQVLQATFPFHLVDSDFRKRVTSWKENVRNEIERENKRKEKIRLLFEARKMVLRLEKELGFQ